MRKDFLHPITIRSVTFTKVISHTLAVKQSTIAQDCEIVTELFANYEKLTAGDKYHVPDNNYAFAM